MYAIRQVQVRVHICKHQIASIVCKDFRMKQAAAAASHQKLYERTFKNAMISEINLFGFGFNIYKSV